MKSAIAYCTHKKRRDRLTRTLRLETISVSSCLYVILQKRLHTRFFCRKDKYQKGLRLFWVDTFISGEVETAAEERLEDEVDCGEQEQDSMQLGGVTPELMAGSNNDSDDDDDDDDDAKTDMSSPSKRRRRAKSSKKRAESSSPGKPSPKKRRKSKDDELEEERFAEAYVPKKPQTDFQQFPYKALNPSPHLLEDIENASDVLENVLKVQGRLEVTSKKLLKMGTPDANKLLG